MKATKSKQKENSNKIASKMRGMFLPNKLPSICKYLTYFSLYLIYAR